MQEDYLVYRFGAAANVELEHPKEKKDSWKVFTYRRDGVGCDHRVGLAASLNFQIGAYRYKVSEHCGLQPVETLKQGQDNAPTYSFTIDVLNTKTGKTTTLNGSGPAEGSLDFGPVCDDGGAPGQKALDRIDCDKDRG